MPIPQNYSNHSIIKQRLKEWSKEKKITALIRKANGTGVIKISHYPLPIIIFSLSWIDLANNYYF
ncbi:hypothetical protein LYNGBM3L_72110 [Moorena producens 3L]|uniref:Uncharacterized protein n=1 Tax=Moorena producens 3L TaxID=489825 RepID=F4Y3B7_9CYAN|nr:hypothetical protein LYNGBM3L_72110 [Moorena producens 3L]NEP67344.1 hypothetical protein [Moorena sp. SIO3A5]OLT63697.1 hypothetical protein BI334_00470 [Moorena producens 3L]